MKNKFYSILLVLISLLYLQCNEKKENNLEKEENIIVNTIDSLGVISYHLPNSEYTVRIKLNGIKVTEISDAFSIKKDEYSVPTKKNGYLFEFNFLVRNPYEHELMIPVPDYFKINVENKNDFAKKTLYDKTCGCYIIGTTEVTNLEDKKIYQIADGECESRNCITFKPNEIKEFKVKFDEPILEDYREIIITGFNLKWIRPNTKYDKLGDVGLVLDVDKELITRLKQY